MSARSVRLVELSLSEAGPGRFCFGRQQSSTDILSHLAYHTIPWVCYCRRNLWLHLALALCCLP